MSGIEENTASTSAPAHDNVNSTETSQPQSSETRPSIPAPQPSLDSQLGGGFAYTGPPESNPNFNAGTYDRAATKWYTPFTGKATASTPPSNPNWNPGEDVQTGGGFSYTGGADDRDVNFNAGTYDRNATKWFNSSKPKSQNGSQPGSGTHTPVHQHDANTGGGFSYAGGAEDKDVNFNSGTYDKGATKWYSPFGKRSPSGSQGARTPDSSHEGEAAHKKGLGDKLKGVTGKLVHHQNKTEAGQETTAAPSSNQA